MKLHADNPHLLAITAQGEGWVSVNGERHTGSLVLSASRGLRTWPCQRFEELGAAHFEELLDTPDAPPELVVFGSGRRLRFVAPALLRALIERGIGVETMDTAAACRTYNILAGEGRRVTAALLLEG
ncbi:MAG: Mth938-like domain-containing protein [Hydrogenophaga sp.]|uniref:Xcc1710-like domain-containing protein n=1 Tax=Hydrogenophaga crocea TaxID=2716225 RepID=A0A6G8IH45_9BURK|nr:MULTISPECIES: Mth938-like domain-containing protein [Hydrogenophaga]MBL0944408.1 Mth938-like domain-containing protein [Hydrogenophaga sp.]QIM52336.1 Xcc1710-like domain-containing protein [Hydrogenophaga crocea]